MNCLKFFALIAIYSIFFGCNNCEELVLEPCGEFTPNSEYCGWTVATCYGEKVNDPVAVIYNTRNNSAAPLGGNWGATISSIHPANWTVSQIGQIFGIAIDNDENIYLASSDIYFHNPISGIVSANPQRPAPFTAGQIFKCSPPTWQAIPFATLPNQNDPLNSIGNIAYDKWNNQLFATNLEDGKIYRISTSGGILETYDPWTADSGSIGIVAQDERAWGIGINNENGVVKVFFPRVTSNERSIYSITLNNGVFPAANSEIIEVSNVPGTQPIMSDLAFSSDSNSMLIAERNAPHNAKVMGFSRTSGWLFDRKYFIGGDVGGDGENSAGGVDFAYSEMGGNPTSQCDEFFWASGNYMMARNGNIVPIYGIQGVSVSGNLSSSAPQPTANQDTDLFIDFDGLGGTEFKGQIGDVEVFDCAACVEPCQLKGFIR